MSRAGGILPLVEFPALKVSAAIDKVFGAVAVPYLPNDDAWYTGTMTEANWKYLDLSLNTRRHLTDLNSLNWTSYLDKIGNAPEAMKRSSRAKSRNTFQSRMRDIHEKHDLERRVIRHGDACLGGQLSEQPDEDWFG